MKKLEIGDRIRLITPNKMNILLGKTSTMDVIIYDYKSGNIINNQDYPEEVKESISHLESLKKRIFYIVNIYKVDDKILIKIVNNEDFCITVPLEFVSKYIDTHPTVRAFKLLLNKLKRGKKYVEIYPKDAEYFTRYTLRNGSHQVTEHYTFNNVLNVRYNSYNVVFDCKLTMHSKNINNSIIEYTLTISDIHTLINGGDLIKTIDDMEYKFILK